MARRNSVEIVENFRREVWQARNPDAVDAFVAEDFTITSGGTRYVPHTQPPPFRQIAVPTTLSAAEFSDLGGCVDVRSGQKQLYTSPLIGPVAVILDPSIPLGANQSKAC